MRLTDHAWADIVSFCGLDDEEVSFGPRGLIDTVNAWSATSNRLNSSSLVKSAAEVLLLDFTAEQVCKAMALHDESIDCSVSPVTLPLTAPATELRGRTGLSGTGPYAAWVQGQWTLLDPLTEEATFSVVQGANVLAVHTIATTDALTYQSSQIPAPFNASLLLRVTTFDASGNPGGVSQVQIQTAAEPVTEVTLNPGGNIDVSWTATQASSYRVVVTNVTTGATSIHQVAGTSLFLDGCAYGGINNNVVEVQVYSVNAVGEVSLVPSPAKRTGLLCLG